MRALKSELKGRAKVQSVGPERNPGESVSLTLSPDPRTPPRPAYVLERLRAVLHREPLLVVPTAADVSHYGQELAAGGVVFGAQVLTFERLVGEIGRVAGVTARPLGRVARDRMVRAAIADAHLRRLAPSAAAPGFAAAAGALFAELQRSLVEPARFTRALRAWGGAPYADELAALYSAYRRRLEALGRPDREGAAWAAVDALRADPARWGRRPVFLYGFDDLTRRSSTPWTRSRGSPRPRSASRCPTSRGATRSPAARPRCRSSPRAPR